VFIDECYINFSGKPSTIKLIGKYDNLIISRSFSKSFGLAGVRLGALITNPYLCRLLNQTRPMREINTFASEIGTFMLENPDVPNSMIKEIIDSREWTRDKLESYGYDSPLSLTNFILVDFKTDKQKFLDKCEKNNILVKDEMDTHKCVEKYVRISIGTKSLMGDVLGKLFPL
jgi:histidinol-phosphate aminotransferase